MHRLLVIACSQRKNPAKGLLPAIDRYDGPAFRVLRKYLREHPVEAPAVLILSAKYGLIAADREIPNYDCRISAKTAEKLRPATVEVARQALQSPRPERIGLCLGKKYSAALDGFRKYAPKSVHVDVLGGGLGRRLARLREWLHSAVEAKVAAQPR